MQELWVEVCNLGENLVGGEDCACFTFMKKLQKNSMASKEIQCKSKKPSRKWMSNWRSLSCLALWIIPSAVEIFQSLFTNIFDVGFCAAYSK